MLNASRVHFDAARAAGGQRSARRRAASNTTGRSSTTRATGRRSTRSCSSRRSSAIGWRPRDQSRPIAQLREQARQVAAAPLLNPASRAPLDIRFNQASLRDVLTFISNATGINVIYDASFQDRPVTVQLSGSIEQALNTLLSSNVAVLQRPRRADDRRCAGHGAEPVEVRASGGHDAAASPTPTRRSWPRC